MPGPADALSVFRAINGAALPVHEIAARLRHLFRMPPGQLSRLCAALELHGAGNHLITWAEFEPLFYSTWLDDESVNELSID